MAGDRVPVKELAEVCRINRDWLLRKLKRDRVRLVKQYVLTSSGSRQIAQTVSQKDARKYRKHYGVDAEAAPAAAQT